LIKPPGKASGHHPRYNEKDLDIIRFVEDLSDFGYSLNQIREKLRSVKNKIESEKRDEIKSELYSTTYVAKIFMHHRSRKSLAMRFKLYLDMDKSAKYIPTYEKSILEKRLEHNTPGDFIRKVETVGKFCANR